MGIGVVVIALVFVGIAARYGDGPVGFFPGGALVEGRLIEEPVPDWSFVDAVLEIELQLLNPPRSRTTWILYHDGAAYIPCGLPNFRLWKQWPHEAVADGRGIVRISGERYRVHLTRVEDSELRETVLEKLGSKYPDSRRYSGPVWLFALGAPTTS